MNKEIKDTLDIVLLNGIGVGMSVTECNEYLTFFSLILAISISCFKLFTWIKKTK